MTVLVTGAAGSVGRALLERIPDAIATDIDTRVCIGCPGDTTCPPCHGTPLQGLDVTDRFYVARLFHELEPDIIYHLAGAKHAFRGELDPAEAVRVNIDGTANVLRYAEQVGAKVVLASTCKACDPETAYGATKLIAERLVLNAGGTVARYYNIPESDGNVFRHWEQIPADEPIPYTDCWRYLIPMERAIALTLAAAELPTGRYVVDPGLARHMKSVAEDLYPARELVEIPRRRGDRYHEPLKAACEEIWPVNGTGFHTVHSPYDPVCQPALVAA